MEKLNATEKKRLRDELIQGWKLANELKNHLGSTTSNEAREKLVRKLLSSYDKSLSVLSSTALLLEPSSIAGSMESPRGIDGGYSDSKDQLQKNVFKKRKTSPRSNEHIRVRLGTTGLEGSIDDGYSWRKYGQKEILGATHPRAYYRCTHRPTKGCNATKKVQRTDEDSSILEISYRGKHTCSQASQSTTTIVSVQNEKAKERHEHEQEQEREGLSVKTEGLNNPNELSALFSFPSNPFKFETLGFQSFSEPLTESIFSGSYSPPSFVSTETSESTFFDLSSCLTNNFELGQSWQSLESDLTDIISTPPSVTNSPFQDFEFSIDQVNFDPSFPLGHLEYFS